MHKELPENPTHFNIPSDRPCGYWHLDKPYCDICLKIRRQQGRGLSNLLLRPRQDWPLWNRSQKSWSVNCGAIWPAGEFGNALSHCCPPCTEHCREVRAAMQRGRFKPLFKKAVMALNSTVPSSLRGDRRLMTAWADRYVRRCKQQAMIAHRLGRKKENFTPADAAWTGALLFESKIKPCFAAANIHIAADWTPLANRRLIEKLAQIDGIWQLHEFEFCVDELVNFANWLHLKSVGLSEEPFDNIAKWPTPRAVCRRRDADHRRYGCKDFARRLSHNRNSQAQHESPKAADKNLP